MRFGAFFSCSLIARIFGDQGSSNAIPVKKSVTVKIVDRITELVLVEFSVSRISRYSGIWLPQKFGELTNISFFLYIYSFI